MIAGGGKMPEESKSTPNNPEKFPIALLVGCIAIFCLGIMVVAAAGGAFLYFNRSAVPNLPTLAAFSSPQPPTLITPSSNEIPTNPVAPTLPGIATTAPPPIVPTQPGSTIVPVVAPGVYVLGVRTEPAPPRRREDIAFDVTFQNTTTSPQSYRVVVYAYRPDQKNSFGETPAGNLGIPNGTAEQKAFGVWRLTGPGGCEDIVVRVGWQDDTKKITLFSRPDGKVFEQLMAVCP